jgi:hypothetical protein
MKVAKNLVFKIEIEIEIIEIHAILKSKLKLKYSKQSKFKSNWPHISVIEIAIEIEIHFKIEITLLFILLYTEYEHSFGNDWPLDTKILQRLEKNLPKLKQLLDIDDDFLREMHEVKCFTEKQLRYMEGLESHDNRNEYLLKQLIRSSSATFMRFTRCVFDCQPLLLHYLEGSDGKLYTCGRREEDIDTCLC